MTPVEIWNASSVNEGYFINEQHHLVGDNVEVKILNPEGTSQPFITPRMAILHTNGGSNSASPLALWNYAKALNITIEPHVDIGLDGSILQFMPFNRRADCNYKANSFTVSRVFYGALAHETQDYGYKSSPINNQAWTWEQIVALIRCLTAECITYKIRCTPPTWEYDSGIGHHSLFPSWSSTAHFCPGNARIRQMDAIRNAVTTRVAQYYELTGGQCP